MNFPKKFPFDPGVGGVERIAYALEGWGVIGAVSAPASNSARSKNWGSGPRRCTGNSIRCGHEPSHLSDTMAMIRCADVHCLVRTRTVSGGPTRHARDDGDDESKA